MIILANLLHGLAVILGMVLQFALILIIARAVISWVNPDPNNPIVRFLRSSTDPMLRPIQRYVPPVGPGIDLSPILAIILLYFLQAFLVQTLEDYSQAIKADSLQPRYSYARSLDVTLG